MNKHLKALHIRFLPEQEQEQNISSREFLKKAEFINIEQWLKGQEEQPDGNSGSGSSASGGSSSDSNSGSDSGTGSNVSTTPGPGD